MAKVTEAVVREIEEKSIKENRSMASILKERGIKPGAFYGKKRRMDNAAAQPKQTGPRPMLVVKSEKKKEPITQLSLFKSLEYLKAATENLDRIFKGFEQ